MAVLDLHCSTHLVRFFLKGVELVHVCADGEQDGARLGEA